MTTERVYTFRPPYFPEFRDMVLFQVRRTLGLHSIATLEDIELADKEVFKDLRTCFEHCDIYDEAVQRTEIQSQNRLGSSDVEKWDEEELKNLWEKYNNTQYTKTNIFLLHYLKNKKSNPEW